MNLVVYHRADFDGLFSAAVCKKFMPNAELVGWDFGDPLVAPDFSKYDNVYVVDLPLECLAEFSSHIDRIVWIDHHKSNIEQWQGTDITGIRIDGVAACRLCWEWFRRPKDEYISLKSDFVDRIVKEPYALRLAGEYDVWDMRDPKALPFQFGLTAMDPSIKDLVYILDTDLMFKDEDPSYCDGLMLEKVVYHGESIVRWQRQFAADVCRERAYVREFHGLKFLILASVHTRNSLWFPEEEIPAEVDALMAWRYDGNRVSFSMYHRPGRADLDLSEIAVQYGGGGHRGACGFYLPIEQALEIVR